MSKEGVRILSLFRVCVKMLSVMIYLQAWNLGLLHVMFSGCRGDLCMSDDVKSLCSFGGGAMTSIVEWGFAENISNFVVEF